MRWFDELGTASIEIPEYYYLNRALSSFDRTHNLNISNIAELPFGRGRRWLKDGVVGAIAGLHDNANHRRGTENEFPNSSMLRAIQRSRSGR